MEKSVKDTLKSLKTNESTISVILGLGVVLVVGILAFNYFRTQTAPTPQLTDRAESTESADLALNIASDDLDTTQIEPSVSPLAPTITPLPQPTDGIKASPTPPKQEPNKSQFQPKEKPTAELYKIQSGDTLWSIAQSVYGDGFQWAAIARENNLSNPGLINAGDSLRLPQASGTQIATDTTHEVVRGEHLWGIAVAQYGDGYQWTRIYEANRDIIQQPSYIEVGWELRIPR